MFRFFPQDCRSPTRGATKAEVISETSDLQGIMTTPRLDWSIQFYWPHS